jgi:hypothetical protein
MSYTVHEELAALASEFSNLRQSKKKWFSETIWQKAVAITQKLPFAEVCKTIKVAPTYLRKKAALYSSINQEQPITFIELIQPKQEFLGAIKLNIETSCGHKLTVEGATVSCLIPLISEFLKGGSSCSK